MKTKRQQALLHIIQTRDVRSQEQLQALLKGRGFDVTQATVSRDINELGVTKSPRKVSAGRSSSKYTLHSDGVASASRLHRFVNELVESVVPNGMFVVIKTPPHCALVVGSELDKAAWPEILGTITGDDTIFCICGSPAAAKRATHQLKAMKRS